MTLSERAPALNRYRNALPNAFVKRVSDYLASAMPDKMTEHSSPRMFDEQVKCVMWALARIAEEDRP
jgi:hypothetical protein